MIEINIEKSIKESRIIYKKGLLDLISGLIVNLITMLWLPFVGLILLIDALNGFNNNPSQTQMIIEVAISGMFLFLGYLIIRKYLTIDNLVRIKGHSTDENQKILRKIANKSNWKILHDNKSVFKAIIPNGLSWGRQLYVLYENDDLLCNITTFGLHGLKSPFHFLGENKTFNDLKTEIERNNK